MSEIRCHDCGCREGEIHMFGCDMEICPKCKGQLLGCGCFDGCYEEDLPEREPFFNIVLNCIRCGKTMPKMKMVSNEEWEKICGDTYPKDCILCPECMEFIKKRRNIK